MALGLAALAVVPAIGQEPFGRTPLTFWPIRGSEGPAADERLDPAGCEVHFVNKDDLDAELIYPCGSGFFPPTGRFFAWLESRSGAMSPYTIHGVYAGQEPREGGKVITAPLAPAGRIAIAANSPWPDHLSLRLLHVDSHLRLRYPKREIFRRVSGAARQQGVQMPEGEVLALLFDPKTAEYVAAARPVRVSQGQTTQVSPQPPTAGSSDLFVILERPDLLAQHGVDDVQLTAELADGSRPPDVVVRGVYQVFAVWYGLVARYASVKVKSATVDLPTQEIVLRPGKLESFHGDLRRLPQLSVLLDLPPEFPADRKIEILRPRAREPIYQADLEPQATSHLIQALPAAELLVTLEAPPWTVSATVDLRRGEDQQVVLSARPIVVQGTVYRGEDPHPAVVAFVTNREEAELRVPTDESGNYQALLFRPGLYLTFVELEGVPGPRYVEMVQELITTDSTLDFHLPDNQFAVTVIDAQTGDGIAGAQVGYSNRGKSGHSSAAETATDAQGLAYLPPLRPGELTVDARAEGYSPAEAPLRMVGEDDGNRRITLALTRIKESGRVRLLLAAGGPAAGAEVRAQLALTSDPLWSGRTDEQGFLTVPQIAEGALLLIRHNEAALAVKPWQKPLDPAEATTWMLEQSPGPLTIRVQQTWGEPVPFARLSLRIHDLWLDGSTLAWLTRSQAVSDGQGFWRGYSLPQAALQVVAWMPGAGADPQSPATVTVVRPPWPEPVELEVMPKARRD